MTPDPRPLTLTPLSSLPTPHSSLLDCYALVTAAPVHSHALVATLWPGTFDHVLTSVMVPPPQQLPTGVPGLDDVLGGGLPEGSCTAIVGDPGTGKTTLAQQILF